MKRPRTPPATKRPGRPLAVGPRACGASSRAAWVLAFAAAFLAQFTEPVCCALSPDVCCAGEVLGLPGPSAAPTSTSSQTTKRGPRECSSCCGGAPVDQSDRIPASDSSKGTGEGAGATTATRAGPGAVTRLLRDRSPARPSIDRAHDASSADATPRSCPAPVKTCGCERDRGTASVGSDAGSCDGKHGADAWVPRYVTHVSPRSFVPARRHAPPRDRWKADTPPTPLRI